MSQSMQNIIKGTIIGSILMIAGSVALTGQRVYAATFDPNEVISDETFFKGTALSEEQIQSFLVSKGSGLANITVDGKRISRIFADAAALHNINPKLLLAFAQKEQGAIQDSTLSEYQLNYLMGFHVNDPAAKGPKNQIELATAQLKKYTTESWRFNYRKDRTSTTLDGITITPRTQGTAALYNYTPYAGNTYGATELDGSNSGNFYFWKLWIKYFNEAPSINAVPQVTDYPSGVLLRQRGTPGVFLLLNGKRYGFWSRQIYTESYSNTPVIDVDASIMNKYPIVGAVQFNEGTLIRTHEGVYYVITGKKRKLIPSQNALRLLGYQGKHVVDVTDVELSAHLETTPFDENHLVRQNGALVKLAETAGVFMVSDGQKHPVKHSYIIQTRFQSVPSRKPTGTPVG